MQNKEDLHRGAVHVRLYVFRQNKRERNASEFVLNSKSWSWKRFSTTVYKELEKDMEGRRSGLIEV
jgi:hypothetical protein